MKPITDEQLEYKIANMICSLVMKGVHGELIDKDDLDFSGIVQGECENLAADIIELVKGA